MKVLLVTGSYPPNKCGVGDYTFHLATALAGCADAEVAVLTSRDCPKPASQGRKEIPVFSVIDGWRFRELPKIIGIIRDWSPDVVHVQYPTQGYGNALLPWLVPAIAFLMGRKVVQTWHEGYGLRYLFRTFLKSVVPASVIVVRPQFKQQLNPIYRWMISWKKLFYIRNASGIQRAMLDEDERRQLRERYLKGQTRLVVFFGFVYPNKGVELLFDIADPSSDQLVIAGEIQPATEYGKKIFELANRSPWQGKTTITGFLPQQQIASLLAIADAVILPFKVGGGDWNTSIHAAVLQGTLVITTSASRHDYDKGRNIYYAGIDDVSAMKAGLATYAGRRRAFDPEIDRDEWKNIALEHRRIYGRLLGE